MIKQTNNEEIREWEEEFNEQYTSMAYGEKWRPGMEITPSMIKSFIYRVEYQAKANLKAKVMALIEEQKRPYDEDAESDHSGAYAYFENRKICDQLLSNLKDL